MTRLILAFSSFFRLLFGAKLHPKAANYLSEDAVRAALPAPATKVDKDAAKEDAAKADAEKKETERKRRETKKRTNDTADKTRDGALALLGLFQREGRLVDFLRESLDDYQDADIGAAVRDIHRGCKKVIDDHLTIEPVMPGKEDDKVTVPKGFDPGEIRLVGEVNGEPPFSGVLRHHGWRATKATLPTLSEGIDRHVLAPAEVEVAN